MDKEKQIEEMAVENLVAFLWHNTAMYDEDLIFDVAESLVNANYRKQREGEWTRVEVNGKNYGQIYYQHKDCEVNETQLFSNPYNFCPNCGAHMRKEDEGK